MTTLAYRFSFVAALVAALATISCTSEQPPAAPEEADSAEAVVPKSAFVTVRPDGAQPLAAVKKTAKAGDKIVVTARVGGRVDPFVEKRAMMIIADPALPACSEIPGDGCKTPWDYCCETPESLLANTATVIVPDAAGKAIEAGLRDVHGLEPLREVVVTGKAQVEGGSLTILAESVFVAPK